MLRRTWTLCVKEVIQIARMPILVLLITLGPLAEMSLIAWATASPIDHLPTAVVDLDHSLASRRLLAKLATTETFDFTHHLDDVLAVNALVETGQVVGALIIPAGYARMISTPHGETATLGFILDGSDPLAAQAELAALEGTAQREGQEVLTQWLGGNKISLSLVQPHLRVRFNEELKRSIYTVPSELGLILFAIGVMLASVAIARERELGTLEQLMVGPISRMELIAAKAIPPLVLAYVSFSLMLVVAMVAFGVPMRGSWVLLMGSASIFLFVELSIGLMISARSSTQLQGMLLAFMWVLIEFFFSGYGVPVENMPPLLQDVANIFPIYHFMILFRAILLKGAGFQVVWPQMAAGLAIGVLVIPTAIWFLGRQQWE